MNTTNHRALPTRLLGQAGVAVSAIGLGCMGMSEFYGPSDDDTSLALLNHAAELGVNFFDTADTYGHGHNETLLGRFLTALPASQRQSMVVATKFGIVREPGRYERHIDNSRAYIRKACEASLKRLNVERIGLYYCHRRDGSVPIEEVADAMSALVREGKVDQIGLSEVSTDTLRRAHAVHPVAALQSEYSLWSREPEDGLLQACADIGATFVAYSPLGRAFLTGEVKVSQLAADDFRRNLPRFSGDAATANAQRVRELRAFADELGVTPAQVALAWLLNAQAHVVPIPGTRRTAYLGQNLGATSLELNQAQRARLDRLFDPRSIEGQRYPAAGMVGIESGK